MEWQQKRRSNTKKGEGSPPKKGKDINALSNTPLLEFDKKRFVSAEAEGDFCLDMLTFVNERGISFHKFGVDFEDRGWFEIAKAPRNAAPGIVGEFYVNARYMAPSIGYVRGCKIDMSPKSINSYCGVPEVANCQFEAIKRTNYRTLNMSEVNKCLGVKEDDWYGSNERRLPTQKLNTNSRAFHLFICARILPTTHKSVVTRDQAIMNWCIQTGKPVNWGKIVHDIIWYAVQGDGGSGYPFPHLITDMCAASGVVVTSEMRIMPPYSPIIDETSLCRPFPLKRPVLKSIESVGVGKEDLSQKTATQLALEDHQNHRDRMRAKEISMLQVQMANLQVRINLQSATMSEVKISQSNYQNQITAMMGDLEKNINNLASMISDMSLAKTPPSSKDE